MIARLSSLILHADTTNPVWRGDLLDAILTTLASRTPEGMVMVPREPTEAMIEAGDRAIMALGEVRGRGVYGTERCWTAMLAPTPSGAE